MGTLLAYALLTVIIWAHNSRVKSPRSITQSTQSIYFEEMGISRDDKEHCALDSHTWQQEIGNELLDTESVHGALNVAH